MGIWRKIFCFGTVILFSVLFMAQTETPNNAFRRGEGGSLPQELIRPRYGEDPRFPRDYVIGDLGRCDASEESYQYARLIVAGLAAGNGKTEGVRFSEQKRLSAVQSISGIGARSWRVGGGRVEPDGAISYLIRFLGRENSITGELYLRKEEWTPQAEEVRLPSSEDKADEESLQAAESQAESPQIAASQAESPQAESPQIAASQATAPQAAAPQAAAPEAVSSFVWMVDDILLERPRSLAEGRYSPGKSDMAAYERFF